MNYDVACFFMNVAHIFTCQNQLSPFKKWWLKFKKLGFPQNFVCMIDLCTERKTTKVNSPRLVSFFSC